MPRKQRQGDPKHGDPWWAVLIVILVVLAILGVLVWVMLTFVFKTPEPTVCIQKGYPAGSDGWHASNVVNTLTASSGEHCLQMCSEQGLNRMSFHGFERQGNCECFGESARAWPPSKILFSNADASFGALVQNERFHKKATIPCEKACDDCSTAPSCIGTVV